MREAPAWLSELQARFGASLRPPLDRSTGTLRASPSAYDKDLCRDLLPGTSLSAAQRLAIYNRQYWCRFFGVLQNEYPLTARLVGFWFFNELAERFLLTRPPRSVDIHEAADGFEPFLRAELRGSRAQALSLRLPGAALLEAAAMDEAWRRAHAAPAEPRFHPSSEEAARLADVRLRLQTGCTFLEESWPLLRLRHEIAADPGESTVALPPRLPSPQSWAIFRAPGGAAQLALAPRQAQLFRLLSVHTLAEALARLESSAPPKERSRLPASVRGWLAQSMELGFWVRVEGPPPGAAGKGARRCEL
jgi:hypothetical protein